jgi:hypothetical protein
MAEYRIHSRGAGLAKAIASGFYSERSFSQLFDYCPEKLLTRRQRGKLDDLLFNVPRLHARRTRKQREKAEELLKLIGPVTKDALVPEARDLLLKRIAGKTVRKPHRPTRLPSHRDVDITILAKWIKQSVELCVEEGLPLNVPRWGLVAEDPSSSKLPLAERSIHTACKALRERGFEVPSCATLRNRISTFPDFRHLIVKARKEEQG